MGLCCKPLSVCHIIPTFNDPKEDGFGKHCVKRRKFWQPAFYPFPTVFFTLIKTEIIILVAFNLSLVNAFNLVPLKVLPFGERLTHSLIHHFEIFLNSKKLQTTIEIWLLKDFKIQIA